MLKYFILLICFISQSWSLNAGLVNYATLFLLHPEMRNYHFGVHNFFVKNDESTTLAKERIEKLLKDLQTLYFNNQQRNQIARKDLWHEQLKLQKRLTGSGANWKSRAKLTVMQKDLETSYGALYKKRQIDLRQNIAEVLQKVFLSPIQRRQRMGLISRDIQKSIEEIRVKKSIDFVVRSSNKLYLPKDWKQNLDIRLLSLELEQLQGDYLRRFLLNQSQKISLQLMEIADHSKADARTALRNNIHIKSLEKYLKKHQSSTQQSMIFGNANDITQEVLKLVYKKNGFGEDRFTIISSLIDNLEL